MSNNGKTMDPTDQTPSRILNGGGVKVTRATGGPVPKARRTSTSVSKRPIRPGKGGGRVR